MRIWVSRMVFGFGQGEKSRFGMGSLRGRRAEAVFVMVIRLEGVVKHRWVWRHGLREGKERTKKKKKMRENKRR